jgi:hypothetical protein
VAFRLAKGALERLPTPPSLPRSYAYGVSRYGCRVIGTAVGAAPPNDDRPPTCQDRDRWLADPERMRKACQRQQTPSPGPVGISAFVWEPERGTRLLHEILRDDHGMDLDGWVLEQAFGISADGTTIVGRGRTREGKQEAWVARLPPPAGCSAVK